MRKLLPAILVLGTTVLYSQTTVYSFDPNRQVHDLRAYTYILVDSLETFTDEQVTSGKLNDRFRQYPSVSGAKKINKPYWLRFSIQTNTPVKDWWLLLRDSLMLRYTSTTEYAEMVYVNEARVVNGQQSTGFLVPRSQKQVRVTAGFSAFSFSIAPSQVQTVYLKIPEQVENYPEYSWPVIHDPSVPLAAISDAMTLRILNAIALIFCILSFFFYFFIKEKSYLFFGLYTLFLSQHYLILHPDLPFIDLYIPEHPQLVLGFWRLLAMGCLLMFLLFGRYFTNLQALSKKTDMWFRIFISVWAVFVVADSISLFIFKKPFFPSFVFYSLVIIAFGFFIRFAFFKNILARFFVIGALWLVVFIILGILTNLEIIDLFFNPWPVGQVGQLLIFAAALAYKVRLNEKARAEAGRIKDMDEIKSKFFANISHEFRTPLSLIQGPLQQIEQKAGGKEGTVDVPVRHIK
ncbi:MAG: 7TM diverse intracellular signaling domain-containing protein, partial [Chitinophagaceae bacterium]